MNRRLVVASAMAALFLAFGAYCLGAYVGPFWETAPKLNSWDVLAAVQAQAKIVAPDSPYFVAAGRWDTVEEGNGIWRVTVVQNNMMPSPDGTGYKRYEEIYQWKFIERTGAVAYLGTTLEGPK